MNLYPVVLCGGSGTRLWPMSRKSFPKQYLSLLGEHSLLQQTVIRAKAVAGTQEPILIANDEQRFLVAEQMRQIDVAPHATILEPFGRNTAPAVAIAALQALQHSADALLLVLPADHVILHASEFETVVRQAAQTASQGYLVTFGVQPTSPETGYGYIRMGEPTHADAVAFHVERFVEKPDFETAREFVSNGRYAWNSGMFLLRATDYLKELARHEPETARLAEAAFSRASSDKDFVRLDGEAFAGCRDISIDHAVMERTSRAAVVPANGLGWSDIGSWNALANLSERDMAGNAIQGDVLLDNMSNSYIRAEHRMVAAVGLEDVVIVETADAVLVAHRDKAQDVKQIVLQLQARGRHECVTHRRVARPWGTYEGIDHGDRFQVKRIVVNPGSQLSLQMHHHRAEHWIVVKGTALITNGDREIMLSENQSTYIPLGTTHRLSNPGKIALELIEVQSGAYLGEDDIVRFEDTYGRTSAG
ncbi:mannose-1-phosphate guanylyltransferase/mannose-6-phosphate isomerase [Burkholderia latens]|uniref:mannose-1-phosphate guanylyltransferase n=1 Tax=Burkholderia latens TaxID=488446 RepID=A0A6H9T623_9BURK|nr:mannose-1-phosphate guanylyltransferase/mannose-6-phosphate isomerase [Burkholderia latens]KAB0644837.1 mannose-1-phosphate guanylyltransferase/mannose-6-phosphate isomerase [Burkholderia latens]VWB16343.1 mannose-1-phosphate guanylyltransferase [Burkholderia latens]